MKPKTKSHAQPIADSSRRSLAVGLLGAIGGAALLSDADRSIALAAAGTSSVQWFDTMADMVATPGSANRQLGMLLSYRTIGDGGEGIFYWDQPATDIANNGTIVGAFATGRWKRIYDRNNVHVDWFGAPHDSVTSALSIFNTALSLTPIGGTLRLGPFTYVINAKWDLQDGKNITGCTGDGGGLYGGTIIRYLGSTDLTQLGCAINAHQFSILKDFRVEIGAGRSAHGGICIGSNQWTTITFDNIGVGCWANSTSYFENAYTIGSTVAVGGCDTLRWIRGHINSPTNAAFLIQGSQPYDLVVKDVNFTNQVAGYLGNPGGAVSHGTILKTTGTYYGSIAFENPNIAYFAEFVDSPLDRMASVSIVGGQWEGLKRFWTGTGNNASASCPFSIEGGRWNTTQLDKPVYRANGSTVHLAASDRRLITSQQGSPVTIRNAFIGAGISSAVDNTATIELNEYASFTAEGCLFPNPFIVKRINTFDLQSGGTYMSGCKTFTSSGPLGNVISPIPERHGPENADFLWTANGTTIGAATTATVPLLQLEMGSGGSFGSGGSTDYLIFIYPHTYTGTPPDAAFRTRIVAGSVKKQSFDVKFEAPPGAGNTITFSVRLQLRSDIP
jgi:hypothetical protein